MGICHVLPTWGEHSLPPESDAAECKGFRGFAAVVPVHSSVSAATQVNQVWSLYLERLPRGMGLAGWGQYLGHTGCKSAECRGPSVNPPACIDTEEMPRSE